MSNGYDAQDMANQGAEGFRSGYQAGYADAAKAMDHIGDANKMVGAAQEAVAWFTDDHLTDKSATTYDPSVAERWRKKGWPVTTLYAATVAAAPVVLDTHGLRALDNCIADLRRLLELAEDFALDVMQMQSLETAIESMQLRKVMGTATTPVVNLERFRPFVMGQRSEFISNGLTDDDEAVVECNELLAWIDGQASPSGGSDAPSIPEPHQECYSDDGGDSWHEHPADAELVEGMAVGETYTLTVSHYSVERTYRVTKAPDETSDDYEVEPVQATSAEVGS